MQANAICEPMIGTLRRELSGRLLMVNEHHLRRVLTEYLLHYNSARHRTPGQVLPAHAHARQPQTGLVERRVRREQVLGGLAYEYQIAA
jgi:putative transposase